MAHCTRVRCSVSATSNASRAMRSHPRRVVGTSASAWPDAGTVSTAPYWSSIPSLTTTRSTPRPGMPGSSRTGRSPAQVPSARRSAAAVPAPEAGCGASGPTSAAPVWRTDSNVSAGSPEATPLRSARDPASAYSQSMRAPAASSTRIAA